MLIVEEEEKVEERIIAQANRRRGRVGVGVDLLAGNLSMRELAGAPDFPTASAESSPSLIHGLVWLSTSRP